MAEVKLTQAGEVRLAYRESGPALAEMAALMPGGQLITIPAGHLVHATQSTRFIAAVTAFLSASALPA